MLRILEKPQTEKPVWTTGCILSKGLMVFAMFDVIGDMHKDW